MNRSRRIRDQRQAGQYYKRKFRWVNFCVYCGQKANQLDHVFPLSIAAQVGPEYLSKRKNFFQGLNLVPTCAECNNLAGNARFMSIREKRKYIQSKIRIKHKKWLDCTIWEKDEIEELGRNMKASVMKAMNNRNLIELRLSWPFADTWVDPEIFAGD